jgi:hypothetical protein
MELIFDVLTVLAILAVPYGLVAFVGWCLNEVARRSWHGTPGRRVRP